MFICVRTGRVRLASRPNFRSKVEVGSHPASSADGRLRAVPDRVSGVTEGAGVSRSRAVEAGRNGAERDDRVSEFHT